MGDLIDKVHSLCRFAELAQTLSIEDEAQHEHHQRESENARSKTDEGAVLQSIDLGVRRGIVMQPPVMKR